MNTWTHSVRYSGCFHKRQWFFFYCWFCQIGKKRSRPCNIGVKKGHINKNINAYWSLVHNPGSAERGGGGVGVRPRATLCWLLQPKGRKVDFHKKEKKKVLTLPCALKMGQSQCLQAKLLARVPTLMKEAWSQGLKTEKGDFQYWPGASWSASAASLKQCWWATVESVHFG